MTNKEYFNNGHIFLKYFDLVFLQLHLVNEEEEEEDSA